jgi:hypothetical protein
MKRLVCSRLLGLACALAMTACSHESQHVQAQSRYLQVHLGNAQASAGDQLSLTVALVDAKDNGLTDYAGTVHFDGDEEGVLLPGDYAFVASDHGSRSFKIAVSHAGKHTLRVSDTKDATLQASVTYEVKPGAPKMLFAVSGDNQGGVVGQALAQPFVVRATDGFGNTVPGVSVTWGATTGGGTITPGSMTTDGNGQSSATGTLGTLLSMNVFTATALQPPVQISFHALSTLSPVMHLAVTSGDAQSGTVATTLAQPLVVTATDVGGNPVPGVSIAWTVASGGGAFTTATTATALDGTASTTFTLGHKAGAVMLAATVQGTSGLSVTLGATGVADTIASLTRSGGDNQTATAGSPLPLPLALLATDQYGNPVANATISWSALDGGAVAAASTTTGMDGTSSTTATLAPTALTSSFQATSSGVAHPVIFTAQRLPFKLAYTDPAPGGKLRLIQHSVTDGTVILDLVVGAQPLTGYSVGFNLPVDATRVVLDAQAPLTPGSGLSPGSAPMAAKAILPTSGPLSGMLVSALSQKASGNGAIPGDTPLPSGTLLYSLKLNLVPAGAPGVAFDGSAASFVLPSGGMRDKSGTQLVNAADVAIGKLEVVK